VKNTSQLNLMLTLMRLTAHRLIRRRTTLVLFLLGLFPCIQVLFWLVARSASMRPYGAFLGFVGIYYFTFFVPILALFMGLGVIADEVDSRNLTFTTVRPLNAFAVVLGRFGGYLVIAVGILCVSVSATYFSGMIFQLEDFFPKFSIMLNSMYAMTIGLTAYLAVVASFGTAWRRFAILGAVIWMIFDNVFSLLPVDSLQAISVKSRMLASTWEDIPLRYATLVSVESSSGIINGMVCGIFTACALAYMIWWMVRFEPEATKSN